VLSELALLESMLDQRPTRFELLTAAAFSWFGDEAVDAMVIEVGLGGTWDSTNVVHRRARTDARGDRRGQVRDH
jgi:folylpolyglutamate synthase/dihydropteroate synthase